MVCSLLLGFKVVLRLNSVSVPVSCVFPVDCANELIVQHWRIADSVDTLDSLQPQPSKATAIYRP